MSMHLMGPYMTTTRYNNKKKKNKTKSQIQAEKDHDKFLRRMGVHPDQRGRSSGVERNLAKVEVVGSNPIARSN